MRERGSWIGLIIAVTAGVAHGQSDPEAATTDDPPTIEPALVPMVIGDAGTPSNGTEAANEAKTDEAKAAVSALKTQQQVPTIRGGTLGIPSLQTSDGVQAMLSGQVASTADASEELPSELDFDLFTRLGGLQLFDGAKFDIIAEQYKQTTPHVDLLVRPVLPRMVLSEIQSVGVRARLARTRRFRYEKAITWARAAARTGIDEDVKEKAVTEEFVGEGESEFSVIGGARFLRRAARGDTFDFSGASAELIVQYSRGIARTDDACTKRIETWQDRASKDLKKTIEAVKATEQRTEQLGARGKLLQNLQVKELAKAEQDKRVADAALKDDVVCKPRSYRVTAFVGGSGTLLHTATSRDDTMNIEDPLFKEQRLTVGAEIQTNRSVGSAVFPRVGVYSTFSRGSWRSLYAAPGTKADLRAFQWEGAFYLSGHLFGGFNALVSLVALKSYGHGPVEFLINVAPAVGAALGGT